MVKSLLVKAPIAIIALIVLILATKYGVANLYYLKVDVYLERWLDNQKVYEDELEDALISADSMLDWHGHNPQYLDTIAKVYEWQAFTKYGSESLYRASLLQAKEYYLQSTQLRPMWPNTWISLALIKVKLNEFDQDFFYYIERSEITGPYNPDVNLNIANTLLSHWDEVPRTFRKTGLEHVKRTLANNQIRFKLLNYSRVLGRESIVCAVAKINKVEVIVSNKTCQT